jgi:hypothetical protein
MALKNFAAIQLGTDLKTFPDVDIRILNVALLPNFVFSNRWCFIIVNFFLSQDAIQKTNRE